MTTYADITKKSKIVRTPELNWLFEEWAGTLYGSSIVRDFNNILETKRANFYCPSCLTLYSAQEAFRLGLEYEVVFPTDTETGKLGKPRLIRKDDTRATAYIFNVDGMTPPAKKAEEWEEDYIQPTTDKALSEKLGDMVRIYVIENKEELAIEKEGWKFNPDSVLIGQPDGNFAAFQATYVKGTDTLYVRGELDQEGNVQGTRKEHLVNLRCHDPKCGETPLKTFRLGTDQTFNPNPKEMKWTAYDKYMLALPEPPLGPDGHITFEKPHQYVTEGYLNALLSEDHAGETMLYLEKKKNQVQRLEIPSSDLPRGWRLTADAAQAYRKKAQHLHDIGIRTPYAQFLRWREQGIGEIKEILEDVETRVRDNVKEVRTGAHETSRIAAAKRIADFSPLTSKPDIFDKYAGEKPPESYLVCYPLKLEIPGRSMQIELKHVPDDRLTKKSTMHHRLKRISWEFLWLRGGQIAEAEAEQSAS